MKQTLVKILSSLLGAFVIGLVIYHVGQNAQAISANQYTCQADGSYATVTSGPGAITGADTTHATQALSWLTSMTKTRTVVTTDSTVTPNTEYASSYTGSISGTFQLDGVSYPAKNDASIEIDSPTTVADNYAGIISGKVLTTPTPNRWIIQVYKLTGSGEVQVAKQALADGTTGNFTIDLSDIVSPPVGKWEFGILDANAGYAPYGVKWPSASYYNGLEVQQKLVTDAIYDWSTTKALVDGTFTFPDSNTGKKLFRLVDTASGDVLAEHVAQTGLIRSFELDPSDPSYGTAFEDQSYVYDQALALFAAIGTDNQSLADTLANGLLNFQVTAGPLVGGFVFAAPQLSPTFRDNQIRTGAHAIATDALLSYIDKYPHATNIVADTAAAHSALDFINGTLSASGTTSGLYLGGYGDYSGPSGSFAPNTVITWASTEHNIDIWNMFEKAAKVFGDATNNYTQKAATLNQVIINKLYSPTEQRYYQGMQPSGVDTADPLDVNTWGAMQMYSSGRYDQALQSLNRLQPFTFTSHGVTGYAPFYDSAGYPGAVPTVWFEGSFGAALAQYHVGNYDAYRTLINQLIPGQQGDGSFQYATDEDVTYGISTRKSVASTAWYILATTGRSAIWNICQYNPPVDPVTPPTTPSSTTGGSTSNSTATTTGGSDNQDMTTTDTAPVTADKNTVTTAVSTPETAADTSKDHTAAKSTFPWTPIIIAGSSVAGVGIVWIVIALIRSRLLLG
ncbi:MAG: hypothetical protein JWO99_614 [Candidatus Saccharibacteria bacterium]|nr:hypothetical protein [Candidatus Saccharibacteria bacterium]